VGQAIRRTLEDARRRAVEVSPVDGGDARLHALGWATVDLERAADELEADLGLPVRSFADADGSMALGARCRIASGDLVGVVALVLLEPSTEGRLAAWLARFGEGVAVAWYAAGVGSEPGHGRGPGPVPGPGSPGRGPFGMEWRVQDAPTGGLLRFLVEPEPGTIGR
jgi:hypothetical protein